MQSRQARELRADLQQYGEHATYFVMPDDRVLLFTPDGQEAIRARSLLPDGTERAESAVDALRALRAWIEDHRLS